MTLSLLLLELSMPHKTLPTFLLHRVGLVGEFLEFGRLELLPDGLKQTVEVALHRSLQVARVQALWAKTWGRLSMWLNSYK